MSFKDILNSKTEKINNALNEYVLDSDSYQKTVYSAMRYSLFAGGKRLRPVIMMLVCEMCGGNDDMCMPFAAAMEMIHTYSLIHDDLPAMDNDDFRRGIPTNHKKFGEAMAILAGDALLNRAFETVTSYTCAGTDNARVLKAIHIMAASSGCEGMIGGQVIDMESEGKNISSDILKDMHSKKTGAIIRSSAVIGAVLAGAEETEVRHADRFADNLGIAFQIRDDILDVIGDENKLGKPVGSDRVNGKNTYVKLFGLEKSKELVKEYSDKALNELDIFGERAENLKELVNYLVIRNS